MRAIINFTNYIFSSSTLHYTPIVTFKVSLFIVLSKNGDSPPFKMFLRLFPSPT